MIGFCAGRHRIYADLSAHRALLRRILCICLAVGLPVSALYTWNCMTDGGTVLRDCLYLLSVYPMGFAYAAGFCLLFDRRPEARVWKLLASTGRMACTNYLGQSVFGVLLFIRQRYRPRLRAEKHTSNHKSRYDSCNRFTSHLSVLLPSAVFLHKAVFLLKQKE